MILIQVFLPYRDFAESVSCMDSKRLVKQLLECAQMMRALAKGPDYKVYPARHPVTRAFRGHESTLMRYAATCVIELAHRDLAWEVNWNSMLQTFSIAGFDSMAPDPVWLTDDELFFRMSISHASSLYVKDPVHYADFKLEHAIFNGGGGIVCCTTHAPYFYPVHEGYENT